MGHDHKQNHGNSQSVKNIKLAFFLNLGFTIAEFFGGLYTNSLAIMTDALHDLGDSLSLGLSWFFEKISQKEKTKLFSYGYKRFSLLAALINAVILLAGSFFILSVAIPRIISPEHSNAKGMLLFAIAGIVINGLGALRVKKGKTMNERMVAWHLFEDVLGWVAVLIVSAIMLVWDVHFLDPALSIVLALYILWNVAKNLKSTVMIFLQGMPISLSIDKVNGILLNLPEVEAVHDTHLWSLDGETHIATTHLVISKDCNAKEINAVKCAAKDTLRKLGVEHATLEIECEGETCPLD